MARRFAVLALVVLSTVTLSAARRRAVTPGDGHCIQLTLLQFSSVSRIAIDDAHVYFVDQDENMLSRMPKNGGPVERLASLGEMVTNAVSVDDTNVYAAIMPFDSIFTNRPGEIVAVPKTGGELRTLANGVQFPIAIDTDETHVYWASIGTVNFAEGTSDSDGKVERVAKDGSGRQTLASDLAAPFDLVVDDANVFYGEFPVTEIDPEMGLRRVPKAGGAITRIFDDYAVLDLAQTDDEIVFYGGSIAADVGGLLHVAKSGGRPMMIVETDEFVSGPEVLDGYAYYVIVTGESEDAMMKVPVAGGTPQLVIANPQVADLERFALDACSVYYATFFGDLIKAPR